MEENKNNEIKSENQSGNEILKSLGRLPDLEKKIGLVINQNEQKMVFMAEMLKQRVEVEMPEEERRAIADAIVAQVKNTPCAMPKAEDLGRQVAKETVENMKTVIHAEVAEAVQEATKYMRVHTFVSFSDMRELVAKKAKITIIALAAVLGCLLLGIGLYFYKDHHSIQYLSKQFAEIYRNEYTSEEERVMMQEKLCCVTFIPAKYKENKELLRTKIKRNKAVLRQRRLEAKVNNGEPTTMAPLEW